MVAIIRIMIQSGEYQGLHELQFLNVNGSVNGNNIVFNPPSCHAINFMRLSGVDRDISAPIPTMIFKVIMTEDQYLYAVKQNLSQCYLQTNLNVPRVKNKEIKANTSLSSIRRIVKNVIKKTISDYEERVFNRADIPTKVVSGFTGNIVSELNVKGMTCYVKPGKQKKGESVNTSVHVPYRTNTGKEKELIARFRITTTGTGKTTKIKIEPKMTLK